MTTKILVDIPETKPTNSFIALGNTISNIIRDSEPHFTIGVYGEWGTGKTTLMKLIEKNLNEDVPKKERRVIPIWFNAWRYEREEQLATIALLKTIGFEMADHIKFEKVSEIISKGLVIFGKDMARQVLQSVFTDKGVTELEEKLLEKIQMLNKIERETIYFDGLNAIKNAIKKIRRGENNQDYRIVVFIDDLDRCSPKKALEVLESIKVFLDIEGFVYVIGMSHNTIDNLITLAYKEMGVEGKEYIKKIIQIPIKLPNWDSTDVYDLIENKISNQIDEKYSKLIMEEATMIIKTVKHNPRQLKRFINNMIIAFETFADSKMKLSLRALFAVQVIKIKMPNFFVRLLTDEDFKQATRKFLADYIKASRPLFIHDKKIKKDTRMKASRQFFDYIITSRHDAPNEKNTLERIHGRRQLLTTYFNTDKKLKEPRRRSYSSVLSKLETDDWEFLRRYGSTLLEIKDWSAYDRATEIVEETSFDSFISDSIKTK